MFFPIYFQLDLPAIKGHYQELYDKPLKADVEKETSGDYRKTLVKIIDKVGEEKPEKKESSQSPEPVIVKNEPPLQSKKDSNKEDDNKINDNDEDAVKLYKAMKGLGTKENVIAEIITRNSNSERQTLKKRYEQLYKKV